MPDNEKLLDLPATAEAIGVRDIDVFRLFERGLSPAGQLVNGKRMFSAEDVEQIRKAIQPPKPADQNK